MSKVKHSLCQTALIMSTVLSCENAVAQMTSPTPNAAGASGVQTQRLVEVYGAWTVTCLPIEGERKCATRQIQSDRQSGKPTLMAELHQAPGRTGGGIMLPNTFAPGTEVRIALDGKASAQKLSIRDCSEKGCAVSVNFSGAAYEKLLTGKVLQLATVEKDGKPRVFAIPLDGFAAAAERSAELTKKANK